LLQLLGQREQEEQRQLLLHFEHQDLLQLPCQLKEEEWQSPDLLPFQWEEEAHRLPQHCLEEEQQRLAQLQPCCQEEEQQKGMQSLLLVAAEQQSQRLLCCYGPAR